jgi:hypothetical protein
VRERERKSRGGDDSGRRGGDRWREAGEEAAAVGEGEGADSGRE